MLNEAPLATVNIGVGGQAIGIDPGGRLYVSLPGQINVYAANPTGTVNTSIATITKSSSPPVTEMGGIAFDRTGRLYVTDNLNGIVVFPANRHRRPLTTVGRFPVRSAGVLTASRGSKVMGTCTPASLSGGAAAVGTASMRASFDNVVISSIVASCRSLTMASATLQGTIAQPLDVDPKSDYLSSGLESR
jgi:hypothetical protein